MKIGIVGGGTSGLICALIIKRYLNCDIDLIYSDNIGTIGVGEGSTEHFNDFMQFCEISHEEIIKECNATLKTGLLFQGWTEQDYFHCITPPFNERVGSYPYVLSKIIGNNEKYYHPNHYLDNKLPTFWINSSNPPVFQYHFDSLKLIEFLNKIAKKRSINLIEDKIIHVETQNNKIASIVGQKNKYRYDFYIDATGFKRVLINSLGAKWKSYSDHLRMNSAFVFQTGDQDNYNMWSLSQAMNNGWMFRTPVWGRYGNGYIFDNSYTDMDGAVSEVEDLLGHKIKVGKEFKFDPGCLENPWIENCCAIGLSSSFVEPIEATAIGSTIKQSFVLMQQIVNYNQSTIDLYNKFHSHLMNNIKEFVFIHYLNKKNSTKFWKDIQSIPTPDDLNEKLKRWEHKLPMSEDFGGISGYLLFHEINFIQVLNGINFFNKNSIKKEFLSLSNDLQINAGNLINDYYNFEHSQNFISHKEYLSLIRNYL